MRILRPGRVPMLHAGIHGTGDRPGLLLFSHGDTAGWNEAEWSVPPLGGIRRDDGLIVGRGAIDCKSLASIHAGVMAAVAASGRRPGRSVGLLLTGDEETGGFEGMANIAGNPEFLSDYSWALGEGGGFLLPTRRGTAVTCQIGERGLWEFAGISNGDGDGRHHLPASFMHRPGRRVTSVRIDPRSWGSTYQSDGSDGTLRISPYHGIRAVRKALDRSGVLDRSVPGRMVFPATLSRRHSPLVRSIRRCSARMGWRPVIPGISPGYSDSRYLRAEGIEVAGFFPVGRREAVTSMHGPDEAIHEITVERAIEAISFIVDEMIS